VASGKYTGDIDDVKYLRDKLFSALKIPQSYLSRGDEGAEDKTTLAQKDIRFARTIQRLQRAVVSELEKIGIIHLYTLGFRAHDLVSFSLRLANPSKLAELQELEHWNTKFGVAATATEGFFSKRWIAKKLFNLTDEEIIRNQREIFFDAKFTSQIEMIAQEAATAAAAGAPMGDMGDMGAAGGEMPPEGLPPAPPPGEEGAPPGPPPEESVLLSEPPGGEPPPPAKRDKDWHKSTKKDAVGRTQATTTTSSKGKWYNPVTHDDRVEAGRKKKYLGQGGKRQQGRRSSYPGYSELDNLYKGLYEEVDSNYNTEEKKILDLGPELKTLLETLEKTEKVEQNKDAKKSET